MADIYWHMTSQTKKEYERIFKDLAKSARAGDALMHEHAKDELQALPGYPPNIHLDLDRVVPVVDDQSSRIVSFGSTIQ